MLGTVAIILVVVWAIKELADTLGIADRIKFGKQRRE